MNCKNYQDAIQQKLTDSLSPALQQELDAHLVECRDCQHYAQQTIDFMTFATSSIVPEQSEEYWDTFYDKIESRIHAQDTAASQKTVSPIAGWIDGLSRLMPKRQPALQFAFVAAVLVIGILIGKVLFTSDVQPANKQVATQENSTGNEARLMTTSLDQRTDRFLDRSKVLLLGMVNMDLDEAGSGVDLGTTRLVADELVKESGPLRSDLADADQQRLMKLIDDLEVILLQIANLEENADIPAIEMVKDGVDKRAVLLKINVSEMRSGSKGS